MKFEELRTILKNVNQNEEEGYKLAQEILLLINEHSNQEEISDNIIYDIARTCYIFARDTASEPSQPLNYPIKINAMGYPEMQHFAEQFDLKLLSTYCNDLSTLTDTIEMIIIECGSKLNMDGINESQPGCDFSLYQLMSDITPSNKPSQANLECYSRWLALLDDNSDDNSENIFKYAQGISLHGSYSPSSTLPIQEISSNSSTLVNCHKGNFT